MSSAHTNAQPPDPPDPTAPPPPNGWEWWSRFVTALERRLLRPGPRFFLWLVLVVGVVVLAGSWVFVASKDKGLQKPPPEAGTVPLDEKQPEAVAPKVGREVDVFKDGNPLLWVARAIRWVEPALEWLAAYPLFPLAILFFWLVSWGGLARGLGLPDLAWPTEWWQRWWVGIAVSLLFANLFFVRYLLEFRSGSQVNFGVSPSLFWFEPPDSAEYALGQFLLWTLIPCLVVFYALKVPSRAYRQLLQDEWVRPMPTKGWWATRKLILRWPWQGWRYVRKVLPPTAIGILVGLAITLALFQFDSRFGLSNWLGPQLRDWVGLRGLAGFSDSQAGLHGRALVMFLIPLVALVVFLLESRLGGIWSPVWSLALLMGLFSSTYGFIAYHLAGLQLVLLLGVIAIAWVCNKSHPYKLSHPGLDDYQPPATIVALDATPAGRGRPAITADEMLTAFHRNWDPNWDGDTEKLKPDSPRPKMILIATSGGGIRAALWTAVVLEGLERAIPGTPERGAFRDHIRLFTGASGGMLGAGLYVADFGNLSKQPSPLSDQLARDSLWPTVQTMLFSDIPSVLLPWALNWDRGRSLEKAWEENTRRYPTEDHRPNIFQRAKRIRRGQPPQFESPLTRTFERMRADEAAAKCPSLLFSPMLVEDCRRALITNLDVSGLTDAYCESLNPPVAGRHPDPRQQSISAFDFFAYFPAAYEHLKVGTAARMSATFPFVGPGVSLPCDPPRRVVDAGYFDNFGVNLMARWLLEHRELVKLHTSGVVLVEIRAYPRRVEKVRYAPLDGKGDLLTWAMSEASTPAEAVINLYARGAYFRNDQLLQAVDRTFNDAAKPDFFTTVAFEVAGQAALSWTLPQHEVDRVYRGWSDIRNPKRRPGPEVHHVGVGGQVQALQQWFGNGGT